MLTPSIRQQAHPSIPFNYLTNNFSRFIGRPIVDNNNLHTRIALGKDRSNSPLNRLGTIPTRHYHRNKRITIRHHFTPIYSNS